MGGLSIPGVSQSNNSGESDSTTKATIGNNIDITIKDEANQTQDIATLNRDTDNAHQSLDNIFDKDKEQERLDEQKLIADIGNQLSTIVRTEGQIRAENAKNDKTALAEAERELLAEGKTPTEQEIKQRAENNAMRDWGTGGQYQQITQAITGALQGAFNGDLTQALANGSAPFLAEAIKNATTNPDGSVNTEANLAAHAILGALLSQANGNSALAGGLGALTAEAAAKLIKNELYGDKSFTDLTDAERQNISALAQIAAAVAGGLAGGSSSDAAQGAITGKNAVENNYLSFEDEREKTHLEEKVKNGTATDEDKQELERLIALNISNQEAVKEACANGMTPECVAQTKLAVLGIESYSGYAEYNTYYNLLENYPEQMAQYGDIINQYALELIHLIDSGYSPEEAKSHLDQQIANNKKFIEAIEKLPAWAQIAITIQDTVGMVYGAKAAGTSLGKLASENKSITNPKVIAESTIGGQTIKDTNQGARPPLDADPFKPTLINDRIEAKLVKNPTKELPNGNMSTAHAEVGVIQQAFDRGLTKGRNMEMNVTNEPVCGYCRGDIAAMAAKSGLKSLTINELSTGKVLYWQPGMKSVREKP